MDALVCACVENGSKKKEKALLRKTKEVESQEKPSYYLQALELDVELLHLHFLPRLQLKREKKVNNHSKYSSGLVKEQSGSSLLYNMWFNLVKWHKRRQRKVSQTCQSTELKSEEAFVSFMSNK